MRAEQVPKVLMQQMSRDALEEHHRWLKRRRRKAICYGLNGLFIFIARRTAVEIAARLLKP